MASADQILRQALSKYRYADISRRDVTNAMTHFKDLRPDHDLFIFNDGNRKELLHLDGTIPVTYKGSIYNIPICVWIMDTHPYKPPMVFVKPTSTMQIKTGRHVDSNGKVDLPYLHDWRFPQSDLLGLIQILAIVFGEEPPVYSKQSQMTQSSFPNSYPGTGKYPGVSRQCIDPETTFNPFAAQAPIHGQGKLFSYRYADISRRDVTNAMTHFKDLRPDHDLFIFNDGNRKELLHLDGTIPVTYKGSIYNIPICVWIMDTHPYKPPMVFVKPTSTMQIKTGRHVDSNGKVDLPYLHDWRFPQSDLLGLIQILAIVFGEEPPVYSKQSQMTQSSFPNSYPGTGKYPGVSRQCIDPETTFNPFAAQAPIHGQGYNLDIFFQTMERFELDDIMNALIEHGVDCVETFCSMTESDFKEIGLNIGQRRKCILAAEHIKNYGLNG